MHSRNIMNTIIYCILKAYCKQFAYAIYGASSQTFKKYSYSFVFVLLYSCVHLTLCVCIHNIVLYTKILEVNLFAFAYRLFHEDFSSIIGRWLKRNLHETVCRQMQTNELLESLCIKAPHLSTLPLVIPEYIWIVIILFFIYACCCLHILCAEIVHC